jgi:hypothetical protein
MTSHQAENTCAVAPVKFVGVLGRLRCQELIWSRPESGQNGPRELLFLALPREGEMTAFSRDGRTLSEPETPVSIAFWSDFISSLTGV